MNNFDFRRLESKCIRQTSDISVRIYVDTACGVRDFAPRLRFYTLYGVGEAPPSGKRTVLAPRHIFLR